MMRYAPALLQAYWPWPWL